MPAAPPPNATQPHCGGRLLTSKRIIAVADSSKFNRVSLHRIIDTTRIDILITDRGASEAMQKGLTDLGVELLLVDEDK